MPDYSGGGIAGVMVVQQMAEFAPPAGKPPPGPLLWWHVPVLLLAVMAGPLPGLWLFGRKRRDPPP